MLFASASRIPPFTLHGMAAELHAAPAPHVFVTPDSLALFLFVAFVVVVSALHALCKNTLHPECGLGTVFFLYGQDQKEKPNACTVVFNLLSHCPVM